MVLINSQIENFSREELSQELVHLSDINIQLKALNYRFGTFGSKPEELKSDLFITKNSNALQHQWIIQLEQNTVNNAQYHWRKPLEVNPVPRDIGDNVLEETIWRAISLTGHEATLDDLHACHWLEKKDRISLKFKGRKLKCTVQINRKVLQQKSFELSQ